MARILLVDDEGSLLKVLTTVLQVAGKHNVVSTQDGVKAAEMIKTDKFDLMISDIRMAPMNGMQILRLAHDVAPEMAVIMVTAFSSLETALEARDLGVFDYVPKPFKVDDLLQAVNMALKYKDERSTNQKSHTSVNTDCYLGGIIARGQSMQAVCDLVKRVAPTDMAVMISGPKGCGRKLVAQTIHSQSVRRGRELVEVKCEGVHESVLESELFGSVRWQVGGEPLVTEGAMDRAARGTLVLEEVTSISMNLQVKIANMLREKKMRRVGSSDVVPVDVRVIAATSQDADDMAHKGTFSAELLKMLSGVTIKVPPLAQHEEDIIPMAYKFIKEAVGPNSALPKIDSEVCAVLASYSWPGNITELHEAMKHATAAIKDGRITKASLPPKIAAVQIDARKSDIALGAEAYKGANLKRLIKRMRRESLMKVVNEAGGDRRKAARALNISLADLNRELGP